MHNGCLVEMAQYITSNPQFVVNRFRRSGIPVALDGCDSEEDDVSEYTENLSEDEDDSGSD